MILNVVVEDQTYPITVPDQIIADAEDFFTKLDGTWTRAGR